MNKGDKLIHPNLGMVEMVDYGEKQSVVKLASGELRTVTTEWLKLTNGKAITPKPA